MTDKPWCKFEAKRPETNIIYSIEGPIDLEWEKEYAAKYGFTEVVKSKVCS